MRRWQVEHCWREDGETWSQTWWTARPLGTNEWHDYPTWREAYDHAASDGVAHPLSGWAHDWPRPCEIEP